MRIDYESSLLGLINSIISKFGVVPLHKPLPKEYLGPKFESAKRVVMILIDALGYDAALNLFQHSNFKYIGDRKSVV